MGKSAARAIGSSAEINYIEPAENAVEGIPWHRLIGGAADDDRQRGAKPNA